MQLTRTPHWATRELHQFLLERTHAPFTWGANDCCFFAADAIKSFTGTDLAADFRGKYNDEASAFAAIKTITGGRSIADAAAWCAKKHGLVELARPLYAQRGDLVLVEDPASAPHRAGRLVAGIVHLNGRHAAVVGEQGLKRLSIRNVNRGWRV